MPDVVAPASDRLGQPDEAPRGASGRVVQVQHQARRSLGVTAAFALVAPVAAAVPHDTGAWLPLHLFLVGGLLSAISGATQLLAVTWSASPAPRPVAATLQRWSLAAGAVTVAIGRELDADAVTAAGGVAVGASLVVLAASLVRIRRAAVTDRFAPAVDAYLVALAFGIAGVALGVSLASGGAGWSELRGAHLTVNVFGLVGIVITGTLPYFTATQARMRMSPLATAARLRGTTALVAVATAVAAAAHVAGRPAAAAGGLGLYVLGIGATVALLPRIGRRQVEWAGPRLVQLAAGVVWWAVTTVVLAADVATEQVDQGPVLRAMVIGGFAQILVASLSYLGPVLRGGGHRRLTQGFAVTGSWLSVGAANVAAVGALADVAGLLAVGLAVWTADAALRASRLIRAGRAAGGPPRTSPRLTTEGPRPG